MISPFPLGRPVQGSELCGRETEAVRAAELLARGLDVLVSGEPGAGLTSLGLAIGERCERRGIRVRIRDRAERVLEESDDPPEEADHPGEERVPRRGDSPETRAGTGGETRPPSRTPRLWLCSSPASVEAVEAALAGERADSSFRRLDLGPIPFEAWLPYVLERFLETGRWIANEQVARAVSLAGGHARRTQEMISVVWAAAGPDGRVGAGDVERALRRVVALRSWGYGLLWRLLTPNQRRVLRGVALESAPARATEAGRGGGPAEEEPRVQPFSSDFLRAHGLGSASSSQRALNALVGRDLVVRTGAGPRLRDPYLARWLRREAEGPGAAAGKDAW